MKFDLKRAQQLLTIELSEERVERFYDGDHRSIWIEVGSDYQEFGENDYLEAEWGFILNDVGELSFHSHCTTGYNQPDLPYRAPIDDSFVEGLMAITVVLQAMKEGETS